MVCLADVASWHTHIRCAAVTGPAGRKRAETAMQKGAHCSEMAAGMQQRKMGMASLGGSRS